MRPPWPHLHVQPCQVEGCRGLAYGEPFCQKCMQELEALRRIDALVDDRGEAAHARRGQRHRFAEVCAAVRKRLWVVNLAIVGGVLVYLGLLAAGAVAEWLGIGGAW